MPALSKPDLGKLLKLVNQFSEEALARAIDEARDPARAAQLTAKLREQFRREEYGRRRQEFSTASLCVVLGEACVLDAIPLLLEIVTCETDLVASEAALYALRRIGPPAFRAAMELITTPCTEMMRVLAYEVLWSAMDADDAARAWVAQFCLDRAAVELRERRIDRDWDVRYAVCYVLMLLRDKRARAHIDGQFNFARNRGEKQRWRRLMDDLDAPPDARPDFVVDWLLEWPLACEVWADAVAETRPGGRGYAPPEINAFFTDAERAGLNAVDEVAELITQSDSKNAGKRTCLCGSGLPFKKCCGR